MVREKLDVLNNSKKLALVSLWSAGCNESYGGSKKRRLTFCRSVRRLGEQLIGVLFDGHASTEEMPVAVHVINAGDGGPEFEIFNPGKRVYGRFPAVNSVPIIYGNGRCRVRRGSQRAGIMG